MCKEDLKAEISRVEKALSKTDSPYLKRDYEKHLKRLRKQLRLYDDKGVKN